MYNPAKKANPIFWRQKQALENPENQYLLLCPKLAWTPCNCPFLGATVTNGTAN